MCNEGDVMLQSNVVKVGIHKMGSFGTMRTAPSSTPSPCTMASFNVVSGKKLGFIADFGRDGWNTGSPYAYSGDYFVPGSPEEGFITKWVEAGATSRTYLNKGLQNQSPAIQPQSIEILSTGSGDNGKQSVLWQGTQDSIKLTALTEFDGKSLYFTTSLTVQNIGSSDVNDFYYTRTVDPDQGQYHNSRYVTKNWVSAQPYLPSDPSGRSDPDTPSKCLVSSYAGGSGSTSYPELFGGLAAINSNCRVGINPSGQIINKEPALPWTSKRWEDFTEENAPIEDTGINLGFKFDKISPGATKNFKFAYVLSEDQVDAALSKLDSVKISSPSSSATGTVLFQITLDSTAGDCDK